MNPEYGQNKELFCEKQNRYGWGIRIRFFFRGLSKVHLVKTSLSGSDPSSNTLQGWFHPPPQWANTLNNSVYSAGLNCFTKIQQSNKPCPVPPERQSKHQDTKWHQSRVMLIWMTTEPRYHEPEWGHCERAHLLLINVQWLWSVHMISIIDDLIVWKKWKSVECSSLRNAIVGHVTSLIQPVVS